jgi:hypothetical protein
MFVFLLLVAYNKRPTGYGDNMKSAMVAETFNAEQTWRLLWSHAAQQVVTALPAASSYNCTAVGYGWGLCSRVGRRCALVIHPSSNARNDGELALTIAGVGTQVIPRSGLDYVNYLDIVATTVNAALDPSA